MELSAAKPGLRERKKQRTRETITQAALRLFAEQGYEHTTLAEIAEAADVSTRTIFSYFESKEDILFSGEPAYFDQLKEKLEHRPEGATTVDALREFLASLPRAPDESMLLRKQIICSDNGLRLKDRARFARVEDLIAQSIAKDLGAGPDDIRPTLVAASVTAAFGTMRDRLEADSGGALPTHEQVAPILDEVLEFLRGGLEALRRSEAAR
jgi:AcrR family transcriptional regulator